MSMLCRVWALVWGAILTCTMTLVPTFRHFRILNIISLTGTFYTAVYLMAISGKYGPYHTCLLCDWYQSAVLQVYAFVSMS